MSVTYFPKFYQLMTNKKNISFVFKLTSIFCLPDYSKVKRKIINYNTTHITTRVYRKYRAYYVKLDFFSLSLSR